MEKGLPQVALVGYSEEVDNGSKDDKASGPASGEDSSTAIVNYYWKQVGQYSHPRPYTLQAKSPNVWLFDSDCNANTTGFKEWLINYSAIYGDEWDVESRAYARSIHVDDSISILGFADTDHASDKNNCESQTGMALWFGSRTSSIQLLFQQEMQSIWRFLVLQEKP